jgi:hypothetical protein
MTAMEIKEKLEQRRREREIEAAIGVQQAEAQKAHLTNQALDVITQAGTEQSGSPSQNLSDEEAEKLIEEAATKSVEGWGVTVAIFGIGTGLYIGFTDSWGVGVAFAVGFLILGGILNTELAKKKKTKMIAAHRLQNAKKYLAQNEESQPLKATE